MPFNYNMGPNAWTGWEEDVIGYLGVPNTKENIEFLDVWQQFEHSNAHNNPLNLTKPTGIATINSAGVQSYSTAAQGALYTANNIKNSGYYPTIYAALQSGKPLDIFVLHKGDPNKQLAIIKELRKWGSGTYADYLSQLTGGKVGQGGSGGIFRDPTTGKDIPAYSPGESAVNFMENLWNEILKYAERAGFVVLGVILVLLAIIFIAKSQASNNTFTFARGDS